MYLCHLGREHDFWHLFTVVEICSLSNGPVRAAILRWLKIGVSNPVAAIAMQLHHSIGPNSEVVCRYTVPQPLEDLPGVREKAFFNNTDERFFEDACRNTIFPPINKQMSSADRRLLVSIHGKTCDVTEYVHLHPGGRHILTQMCDQENNTGQATANFEKFGHSAYAQTLVDELSLSDASSTTQKSGHGASVKWWRWVRRKLFTSEDNRHLHKILGVLSCLHLFPRCVLACVYGFDVVGNNWSRMTRSCLVVLQLMLSMSSLQFHVPSTSHVHKPMIHALFRVHSLVFATRTVVCTLCLIWCSTLSFLSTLLRAMSVLLTMIAADKATYHMTDTNDHFQTIRSLLYWPGIPSWRLSLHKGFYSFAQFGATYTCFCIRSELMVLSTLLGIQGVAFLMTLARKSIIQSHTLHVVYVLLLLTSAVLHICTQPIVSSTRDFSLIFLLYVARVRWHVDKFLLWGSFVCGSILVAHGCHLPTLGLVLLLCGVGQWSHQKDLDVVGDPTSRVLSNVHTGDTHCRLQVRTRNRLENFKPGQFVTIGNGRVTRKYSPLSVSPLNKQSIVELAIRRAPSGPDSLSDYLYHRSIGEILVVDGPFGRQYYDAPTTTIHSKGSIIRCEPGIGAVVLVSGGSGLAPMYSMAEAMLASGLRVILVTSDTSEETALLRVECAGLSTRYHEMFLWYRHLSSTGKRLQKTDLVEYTSPNHIVCACGPPGLLTLVRKSLPSTQTVLLW